MPYIRSLSLVAWTLPFVILSGSCHARPECDSIDTRSAVLKFILEDRNNPLLDFATRNSTATPKNAENTKPLYQLGQRMVAVSTTRDKLTLTCSGGLSVAVGDLTATKEVTFTVQQSRDGTLSVSVEPFQF